MTIGDKLRHLRIKTKRTLKEQSEIFGVSLNSVYRWEHDLTAPKKTTLRRISEYYGVPVEWLLMDDADEYSLDHLNSGNSINGLNNTNGAANDDSLDQQLLKMFRKLSENKKYKILGYIERIYIEDMDEGRF
ncbi:MAG: helix-turn-helix domain-containing protein [Clostridiales bacterium]|nr:helix-turn-helix domain-containing protein [Clostridiales bacterium]